MLISSDEVSAMVQRAIREGARKIGISDADYLPAAELLPLIERADAHAHHLVIAFAEAYGDWFRVVERLEVTHPQGAKTDAKATSALTNAMKTRDDARAALVEWLRS